MSVTMSEALELILKYTTQTIKTEIVKIEDSSFRISSKTIKATLPLPKFDNSAMDGYAICENDIGKNVTVTHKIFAGDNKDLTLENGTAIKVMTGARVPIGTWAIVPQENVEQIEENKILLPDALMKNHHVRFIGEDVQVDDKIVDINEKINFATITLLASQGITDIEVFAKPKVAVFGSGEELRPHYEKIEEHQIYNSNSPSLISRVKELGCEATFVGSAKDNLEDLKLHIKKSLDYDLVITTGGVSVGEADFTKEAFESFDMNCIFNGIIIKPGKPTIFGKINNTFVLNLPGNPLASQLVFELFGKIVIQKLLGSSMIYHNTIKAKMANYLDNRKGRPTIVVGYFDGEYFNYSKKRSPGMVSVLNSCNSMIVLEDNVQEIKVNDEVKVLPLNWKFFTNNKKDFLTYEQ